MNNLTNEGMDPIMHQAERYVEIVHQQLGSIRQSQWENIRMGGQWIGEALLNDRWFYTFGTGHSRLLAEEVFHRAGGLTRAVPILDPMIYFSAGAQNATDFERQEGAALKLLEDYPVGKGDVILVASNSGRNPLPIEMALHAREKGMKVIALLNANHAAAWPSRHPSGKNLGDVADLVLDNAGIEGDAAIKMEGIPGRVAATSTITGAFLVNLLVVTAVATVQAGGGEPEIYISSNSDGDAHNARLAEKYRHHIRHL